MKLDDLDVECKVEINRHEKKIRVYINEKIYEFTEENPALTIELAILTILKDQDKWRSQT